MKMTLIVLVGMLSVALPALAQDAKTDQEPATPKKPEPVLDQAALDKQFEQTMTGATLVGRYTVEGRGDRGREPKEDRYQIIRVSKTDQPDRWLFMARIQFGNKDVTIPMVLPVKWAGDTPVICVTDMGFPGLGTYTARVMIYKDHYAGTWSGADHGGHLWGRIERSDSAKPASSDAAKEGRFQRGNSAKPPPAQ